MAYSEIVIWDPLTYLSVPDLSRIDEQFDSVLGSETCLVFWTGLDRALVQRWADKYRLKTLVGAMGALFDGQNPDSPRHGKSKKGWSKFMKGASGRFAEYACQGRRAIVLMNPPPNSYSTRTRSTFRCLEEPILTGAFGGPKAVQIDYVHPVVECGAEFHYKIWPVNRSSEWPAFCKDILQKNLGQKAVEYAPLLDDSGTEKARWSSKTTDDEKSMRGKSNAKRWKVEEEQKQAQERRDARRKKAEEQQKQAQEKRAIKQGKVKEEQRQAQERRDARRKKAEEQQKQAQEKRAIKQGKVKEKQRQTQERRDARRKAEEQQKQARERRDVKQVKMKEEKEAKGKMGKGRREDKMKESAKTNIKKGADGKERRLQGAGHLQLLLKVL